jgi:hypothetical protein
MIRGELFIPTRRRTRGGEEKIPTTTRGEEWICSED